MALYHFRTEAGAANVHAVPDARAGEGVPLQPVPDAKTEDRDRARALPHREADQDLVPEPTHEVEEGEQDQRRAWLWRRAGQHESTDLATIRPLDLVPTVETTSLLFQIDRCLSSLVPFVMTSNFTFDLFNKSGTICLEAEVTRTV